MLATWTTHCSKQSALALAPDNAVLRLSEAQTFSCGSHQSRSFGVDAWHDMDTLTSLYVKSDDAAGYAFAW